jgi:hypothetical protein
MDGAYSRRGGNINTKFWSEDMMRVGHLRRLGLDGRIILK